MLPALGFSFPTILVVFALLWAHQRRTKNATLVDAAWALGIGAHTALLGHFADGEYLRRLVVVGLVGVWSVRLGGHLFFNRILTGHEDGRYKSFRDSWSQTTWFGFYMLQGLLVFALPLTFLGALRNTSPFPTVADAVGIGLWFLALAGETLADAQLERFRADPARRGKTCRVGLWRYSRHPNYFFEWLLWISFVPLAWGSPLFAASLAGPVLMFLFLTRVSGIPPAEAQALRSRGDDYRDYQRTTSAFFPWPPRS